MQRAAVAAALRDCARALVPHVVPRQVKRVQHAVDAQRARDRDAAGLA